MLMALELKITELPQGNKLVSKWFEEPIIESLLQGKISTDDELFEGTPNEIKKMINTVVGYLGKITKILDLDSTGNEIEKKKQGGELGDCGCKH
jgi:hypothetical protein